MRNSFSRENQRTKFFHAHIHIWKVSCVCDTRNKQEIISVSLADNKWYKSLKVVCLMWSFKLETCFHFNCFICHTIYEEMNKNRNILIKPFWCLNLSEVHSISDVTLFFYEVLNKGLNSPIKSFEHIFLNLMRLQNKLFFRMNFHKSFSFDARTTYFPYCNTMNVKRFVYQKSWFMRSINFSGWLNCDISWWISNIKRLIDSVMVKGRIHDCYLKIRKLWIFDFILNLYSSDVIVFI